MSLLQIVPREKIYVGSAFMAVMGLVVIGKGVFGNFDQFNIPLALKYCPIWVYRLCCIIAGLLLLVLAGWRVVF